MNFEDLLSRADEDLLQDILGSSAIRILTNLDQTRVYNEYLRNLILGLYGSDGLLLNKKFRALLFDLLRESEAKELGLLIGINRFTSIEDLYKKLRDKNVRRGSTDEESIFKFFNLIPPPLEVKEIQPSFKNHEGEYQLFNHQRVAARKVTKLLNEQPHRVLLHMPTGSGKTRTAMNLIADHLRQTEPTVIIWLATSEELCEQAAEEFEKSWFYLGNRPVEVHRFWGNNTIDLNNVHDGFIVAGLPKMVQSIKNPGGINFISRLANKSSLVIMDEAHQAIAPTYKTVLDVLFYAGKENRLLGLSATPGRTWSDIKADSELAEYFSKQKVRLEVDGYSNPVDYLVDQGYLAKYKFKPLFYDTGNITSKDLEEITKSIDIPLQVLKALGEDEQRNLKIIYEVEKLLNCHTRIILFAPSVESSNLLALILRARGHISYSVTGETASIKRKQYIEDYKNDDDTPKILCNYGVLTTGFDAPRTSAAVIARPTLSLVLYSQMVGRAIRGVKAGGNLEAEIVTIVDQGIPGFGTVAESFNNWEDVWE